MYLDHFMLEGLPLYSSARQGMIHCVRWPSCHEARERGGQGCWISVCFLNFVICSMIYVRNRDCAVNNSIQAFYVGRF